MSVVKIWHTRLSIKKIIINYLTFIFSFVLRRSVKIGTLRYHTEFSKVLPLSSNDETSRRCGESLPKIQNRQRSWRFLRETSEHSGKRRYWGKIALKRTIRMGFLAGFVLSWHFRLSGTGRARIAVQSFGTEIKRTSQRQTEKTQHIARLGKQRIWIVCQ